MAEAQIGIIGGSGLGDVLIKQAGGNPVALDTPFGAPSSPPVLANWEGTDVAFIARHGPGHVLNPSAVPYRANIWAMKQLGVEAIIASGATGSLREQIEPGQLVLCDQVIDKTFRRESTFFDSGAVAHVEFAEPFCPHLREVLTRAGQAGETVVHPSGTYVCMEGPQFSTRAESNMHRAWGGDLIGMTCMPEAKLAREAEMCYALVALPTDYDCWRPHDAGRKQDELLREILGNLKHGTDNAITLMRAAISLLKGAAPTCACRDALALALWTDKGRLAPAVKERLGLLIDRYMPDSSDKG